MTYFDYLINTGVALLCLAAIVLVAGSILGAIVALVDWASERQAFAHHGWWLLLALVTFVLSLPLLLWLVTGGSDALWRG